ncbi:MAG: TIGR03984 family CRISPR-associated protein [Oscillatoriales cyanobacterium RU_3_3]|nr:TIGR03984 family CRISPR-associated protein [Oscillatoriales cyanobacterium RU_3_3]
MSHAIAKASEVKDFSSPEEFHSWLREQATSHQLKYLLAHADDGVIWGRFDNGKLTTAEQVFYPCDKVYFPKLRLLTLQQCRIFGQNGEVLLWRTIDRKFKWRFIGNPEEDKISESQILWGTNGIKKDNFTLLWDGSQGLKHAVPFTEIELDGDRLVKPVHLLVHHYIKYEKETGLARIYLSRLVDLTTK